MPDTIIPESNTPGLTVTKAHGFVVVSWWQEKSNDGRIGTYEYDFRKTLNEALEVYREYQHRLEKAGAMDFDDLLTNVVRLFRQHPDVLRTYQERFQHILIDEYQDTNMAQNAIVLMLGAAHHNVCVVGDTDQSVYRFRGADFRNILEFENAFPEVTTVVLAQNYRSTQVILDAANAVITHNEARKPKELWTDRGAGEKIVRYFADDEFDEANWVVARLRDFIDLRQDVRLLQRHVVDGTPVREDLAFRYTAAARTIRHRDHGIRRHGTRRPDASAGLGLGAGAAGRGLVRADRADDATGRGIGRRAAVERRLRHLRIAHRVELEALQQAATAHIGDDVRELTLQRLQARAHVRPLCLGVPGQVARLHHRGILGGGEAVRHSRPGAPHGLLTAGVPFFSDQRKASRPASTNSTQS